MRADTHARLTTAAAVAAAGMGGGHLLLPHAPGASPARAAAYYALMLAVGALGGWREAVARAERAAPGERVAPPSRRAGAYAVGAALLAAAAYRATHGG